MSDDVVEALHLLQLSDSSTKSHVDSLPVEILTCILNDAAFNFWTSSDTDDSRWKFTSDARREEIRLERQDLRAMASVCIRWRDVILRTPSFWSTISVDSRAWDTAKESMGANRVDPERLFALLALNLRRGSSHPLTLAIHADTDNSYFSVRILRFLALHSERWKDVSLWLTSNSACFLSRIAGRLPALERLRVEFTCTDDVNPPFDVFADAPRLHALELISTSKYLPTVPWAQLRTFKCVDNDLSWEALPHLGSALAKLTRGAHCALDLTIYHTGRGPDLEERIQCPLASLDLTLSRLWLMADDYELELPLFFEMFTFPNLCALALRTDQNDDCAISLCARGLAAFTPMAQRSRFATNLTRLAIAVPISRDHLLAVLDCVPNLEDLAFADRVRGHGQGATGDIDIDILVNDTTFTALSDPGLDTTRLPRLSVLRLTTCGAFTNRALFALVGAQAKSTGKQFVLELCPMLEHWILVRKVPFDVRELEELGEEVGADVKVVYDE